MMRAVIGPRETLAELQKGASISRFGDGEYKLMTGQPMTFQRAAPRLAAELEAVLRGMSNAALTGVFHDYEPFKGRRAEGLHNWAQRIQAAAPPDKVLHSTLISRPDVLTGWGETPDYFDTVASLWRDKRVTLIANGERSLTPQLLMDEGADGVDFVDCAAVNAYDEIDALYERALHKLNHTVLLCAGPTATCLAERLARAGRQAIDIGHVGIMWRKYKWIPDWHARFKENSVARDGTVIPNRAYQSAS
jgi:hypothetical protein